MYRPPVSTAPPGQLHELTLWRSWPAIVGATVLVVVTCVAYVPAMRGGFILDDDLLLLNDLVKDPGGLYRMWFTTDPIDYWPVSNSTLWIEWRLWGTNPLGYHLTNLLIHLATALLVWAVLQELAIPGGFLAALLFTVHPVNVESVAWISQRKTIMATFFFLLSILWYLKADPPSSASEPSFYRAGRAHWYWLSLFAFLLGMLSKGSIATFPLVLLLVIWWYRGRIGRWDLARVAPFFLVAIPLVVVNIWFRTHGSGDELRSVGLVERLLGAAAVPWFYLYKAILPFDLIFIYPQWQIRANYLVWLLPLLASIGATGVLWWWRRTWWGRPLLFAWTFVWLTLLPVLGFVDVSFMKWSLVNDHYQYVSIIAVVALAAAAWSAWSARERQTGRLMSVIAAAVVVVVFAALTWRQTLLYVDEQTIYTDTVERNPSCWMAYSNLGLLLLNKDRPQEAIERFQQALAINPDVFETHNNMGNALVQLGRLDEAIKHYQEAVKLKTGVAEIHDSLGRTLLRAGRPQKAIESFQQVLRLKPEFPQIHAELGMALLHAGRFSEAIEQLNEATRLKAADADSHNNLGVALLNVGRIQEAAEHLELTVRLKPDYSEGWGNVALVDAQIGRPAAAIAAAEKAIELARSQGQTDLAKRIDRWLLGYRASQTKPAEPSATPVLPPN